MKISIVGWVISTSVFFACIYLSFSKLVFWVNFAHDHISRWVTGVWFPIVGWQITF